VRRRSSNASGVLPFGMGAGQGTDCREDEVLSGGAPLGQSDRFDDGA